MRSTDDDDDDDDDDVCSKKCWQGTSSWRRVARTGARAAVGAVAVAHRRERIYLRLSERPPSHISPPPSYIFKVDLPWIT